MGHPVVGDGGGYCRLGHGHGHGGSGLAKLSGVTAFARACRKTVKPTGGTWLRYLELTGETTGGA
ncbi:MULTISPECIES: hypothetical protein [Photorhabdus]|uniref:hypothetical protein n=1 Tax=Photorhabdus TaxID=29487 RepID=UPI001BD4C72A|nr:MULTISPECIES: hypothetical protein [Photorhabdus]